MTTRRAATAYVAHDPRSPAARPRAAVATPTTSMVARTAPGKARATRLLLRAEFRASLPEM